MSVVIPPTLFLRAQQQSTSSPPQRTESPGTLAGIVVRDGTLEPLRDVEVSIGGAVNLQMLPMLQSYLEDAKTEGPPERIALLTQQIEMLQAAAKGPLPVLTDKDGRFTIEQIPPGQHIVTARKEGYFSADYSPGAMARPVATIGATITSGQTTEITLRMIPGAAVSGRAFANGKPVIGRLVEVLRRGVDLQGTPGLQVQQKSSTNDRGEYRIFDLPPGEYFIAVSTDQLHLVPGGRTIIVLSNGPLETRTFYPSATESADAIPIRLQPGEDRTGVDIQMRPPVEKQPSSPEIR